MPTVSCCLWPTEHWVDKLWLVWGRPGVLSSVTATDLIYHTAERVRPGLEWAVIGVYSFSGVSTAEI